VLISGLESTACPFCWVANILTSCWKNHIPQQGSTNPRHWVIRVPDTITVIWNIFCNNLFLYIHSRKKFLIHSLEFKFHHADCSLSWCWDAQSFVQIKWFIRGTPWNQFGWQLYWCPSKKYHGLTLTISPPNYYASPLQHISL
jgi:hypothetical protein